MLLVTISAIFIIVIKIMAIMIIIITTIIIIVIIVAIIITIIICIQEDVGCRRDHLTSRAGEPRAVVSLGDLSDASLGSFLVTMLQSYNVTLTYC